MSPNPKTRRAALIAAVNAYCDVLERAEQGDPRDLPAPAKPTRRRGPVAPAERPPLDDVTRRAVEQAIAKAERNGYVTTKPR